MRRSYGLVVVISKRGGVRVDVKMNGDRVAFVGRDGKKFFAEYDVPFL